MNEKPKRRWFAFRLRTLFVAVAILACGLGWVAFEAKRVRDRIAASMAMKVGRLAPPGPNRLSLLRAHWATWNLREFTSSQEIRKSMRLCCGDSSRRGFIPSTSGTANEATSGRQVKSFPSNTDFQPLPPKHEI